jgi:hypothetical protein
MDIFLLNGNGFWESESASPAGLCIFAEPDGKSG